MQSTRWSTEQAKPFEVITLPYQRFSDHLIARHLLKSLNTKSTVALKRSFYKNQPLGKVFALDRWGHSFAMPGIATAIMLEFPERVRRLLPLDERELVFYLPKSRRLAAPTRQVFLDGLHWRAADSYSRQTTSLINTFLMSSNEFARYEVLEILVELGTRPGHPISADRLRAFLVRMPVAQRDLFWSEFLRSRDDQSIVYRIMAWIERTKDRPIDSGSARALETLLSLFLTTTRKTVRDQATRGLVRLGLHQPQVLFDLAAESLVLDDPYVPERMLSAAYGVAMNGWADPSHKAVQLALPQFASRLIDDIFVPGASAATRHVLLRDSALGIIDLARRIDRSFIPPRKRKWLRPPFAQMPERFPLPASIDDGVANGVQSVLQMDFENYTIGHLVPNDATTMRTTPNSMR